MFEIHTAQSLLRLDPDLGQLLAPARYAEAEHVLRVSVASCRPGDWHPDRLAQTNRACNLGLLVLEGAILREVCIHDAPSAELARLFHARPSRNDLTPRAVKAS